MLMRNEEKCCQSSAITNSFTQALEGRRLCRNTTYLYHYRRRFCVSTYRITTEKTEVSKVSAKFMYFLSFNDFVTPACDRHGRGRHAFLMLHVSFKLESSLNSRYKDVCCIYGISNILYSSYINWRRQCSHR